MKKIFYLSTIFILCLYVTGCVSYKGNIPNNLRLIENELRWDEVENATGYIVNVNGIDDENIIEDTKYLIEVVEGISTYAIKVKAIFNDNINDISNYSNTLKYSVTATKLENPKNVHVTENIIVWNQVENALSYIIMINDNEVISNNNTYVLSDSQIENMPLEIKILAVGDGALYANSEWSDSYFFGDTKISQPSFAIMNIRDNILKFNMSPRAEQIVSYALVNINGVTYKTEGNDLVNGFSMKQYIDSNTTYLIKVKYCSDDISIANSEWSKDLIYSESLTSPTNVRCSSGSYNISTIISWDKVDDVDSYTILVDGVSYSTLMTSILVPIEFSAEHIIKVCTVKSSKDTYYCSPYTTSIYSISLNAPNIYAFPSAYDGYQEQTPYSVTINNNGNVATGELSVKLSGTNSNSFTIKNISIPSIAAGGNGSFTITPKTGLSIGTYIATVTVFRNNGLSATFHVVFNVNPAPEKKTLTAPIIYLDNSNQKIIFDFTESQENIQYIDIMVNGMSLERNFTYEEVKNGLSLGEIGLSDIDTYFAIQARFIGDNIEYNLLGNWSNPILKAKKQLTTPQNIQIIDNIITWNEVQYADHYKIFITLNSGDEKTYEVSTNNFVINEEINNGFLFYIMACADESAIYKISDTYLFTYSDSAKSKYVHYGDKKLPMTISQVYFFGPDFIWLKLSLPSHYILSYGNINLIVNIDDVDYEIINLTTSNMWDSDIIINLNNKIDYTNSTFKFKFVSDNEYWQDSEWSIVRFPNITAIPENLSYDGTIFRWDAMDNIVHYEVTIYPAGQLWLVNNYITTTNEIEALHLPYGSTLYVRAAYLIDGIIYYSEEVEIHTKITSYN